MYSIIRQYVDDNPELTKTIFAKQKTPEQYKEDIQKAFGFEFCRKMWEIEDEVTAKTKELRASKFQKKTYDRYMIINGVTYKWVKAQ